MNIISPDTRGVTMNKKSIGLLALFLASFGFVETASFADNYTIEGKIRENKNLAPVVKAKVSYKYDGGGEISTTTDDKGYFILNPETEKPGNFIVSGDNFKEIKEHYGSISDKRYYQFKDVKIGHNYYSINGMVTDYVTYEPIKDAEVTFVYEYGEGQTDTVKTDEMGRYTIKPEVGKNGMLQIVKDGYADVKEKFSSRSSDDVLNNYNYEMRPSNEVWTITGKAIEYRTLFPIASATVSFVYKEGGQVATTTTDALGNFELKPLINKKGTLYINAKDFKPIKDDYSSRGSGRDTYQYTYKMYHDYWTVSGTLVDYTTYNPAVGVNVCFKYDKTNDKTPDYKTDENGYYNFRVLADKGGTLEFSGDEWIARSENIGGRGSDGFEVWNYEMHKKGETYMVSGRIAENATKNFIEGAKVAFVYDEGGELATETNKFGVYTLYPEINKPGKIVVSKDSYITYTSGGMNTGNSRDKYMNYNYNLSHNYWTLEGKITDYKTRDGVKGATITFYYEDGSQIEAETDENGFYKLMPENNKKGKIAITCKDYTPRREGETYGSSDDYRIANYEINRAKETFTITGRIVSNANQQPIKGADIEYVANDGTKYSAVSDENGLYTIDSVVNQEGTLTVTFEGYEKQKNNTWATSDSRERRTIDFGLNEKPKENN